MAEELLKISSQMGMSLSYLQTLYKYADKYYKCYFIKKKSSKKRLIAAPNYEIKAIQSWVLRTHLENAPISPRAFGFIKKRNIKMNAQMHLDRKFVMCLDIEDFFPSIDSARVSKVFKNHFHSDYVAEFFTRICTFKGALPQGGVTSPVLSNIIFYPLDEEIMKKCNENNIGYSRYADDMTFSSDYLADLKSIKKDIEVILSKQGFNLNEKKTRFMSGKKRKAVTGVILNSRNLTVGKDRKRLVRAALFNYKVRNDKNVNLRQISGLISFIKDIEPNYMEKLKNYNSRLEFKKLMLR
jgi:RNA-directed DNA polymerase